MSPAHTDIIFQTLLLFLPLSCPLLYFKGHLRPHVMTLHKPLQCPLNFFIKKKIGWSVGSYSWCRLKYLHWMGCHELLYRNSWSPLFLLKHLAHCASVSKYSLTDILYIVFVSSNGVYCLAGLCCVYCACVGRSAPEELLQHGGTRPYCHWVQWTGSKSPQSMELCVCV